jgi:hypothetical protein
MTMMKLMRSIYYDSITTMMVMIIMPLIITLKLTRR